MEAAPWRLAAAGVAGSSHALTGAPCQDSLEHDILDAPYGRVLIGVVSDGAGSAAHSDEGSRRAVRTLLAVIAGHAVTGLRPRHVDGRLAGMWYTVVSEDLERAARELGRDPRDYACTLLAAFVADHEAVFLQLGDGAMAYRMAGEETWTTPVWPQHGEYANTTNFLPGKRVTTEMEVVHVEGRIEDVALFTDGLENLVLDRAARLPHGPFFEHVAGPVRRLVGGGNSERLSGQLASYLSSPAVTARTDDDVTLVVASRSAMAGAVP